MQDNATVDNSLTEVAIYPKVYYSAQNKLPKGAEYIFHKNKVKLWSTARLHAWKNKHQYPDAFYYRFVDPDQYQTNGGFSTTEHEAFMKQVEVFSERGWLGSSWGMFSLGVPHKAGYQCSAYYRTLLEKRKLVDSAYTFVEGKLTMVNKSRKKIIIPTQLSSAWEDERVLKLAAQIDSWVLEFHSNSSVPKISKPISTIKPKKSISNTFKKVSCVSINSDENSDSDFDQLPKKQKTISNSLPDLCLSKSLACLEISEPIEKPKEIRDVVNMEIDYSDDDDFEPQKLVITPKTNKKDINTIFSSNYEEPTITKTTFQDFFEQQHLIRPKVIQNSNNNNRQIINSVNKSKQTDLSLFWKDVKPPPVEGPEPSVYKIPETVPPTWANLIRPMSFLREPAVFNISKSIPDIFSLKSNQILQLEPSLSKAKHYLEAILIDPPWPESEQLVAQFNDSLKALLSETLKLVRSGFVFIWVPKLFQLDCLNIATELDLRYVENLVWCQVSLENQFIAQTSNHFRSSKSILLIFKKGEEVDIRHQRSPDVIFDFVKPKVTWSDINLSCPKPWSVYDMIEILLPNAKPSEDDGLRLLEIWAKVGKFTPPRSGWIQIHQSV